MTDILIKAFCQHTKPWTQKSINAFLSWIFPQILDRAVLLTIWTIRTLCILGLVYKVCNVVHIFINWFLFLWIKNKPRQMDSRLLSELVILAFIRMVSTYVLDKYPWFCPFSRDSSRSPIYMNLSTLFFEIQRYEEKIISRTKGQYFLKVSHLFIIEADSSIFRDIFSPISLLLQQ